MAEEKQANTQQVYSQAVFINRDKNGREAMSIGLRTSIQGNEKGGNGFPVTTLNKDGKPSHFITLGMEEAKSGPHKGMSEAERFFRQTKQVTAYKDVVKNAHKELDGAEAGKAANVRVPELEGKAVELNAFNGKESGEKNAIYYTDKNGQLVNGRVKTDNGYKPNPEAVRARIANIEETVHKTKNFDMDKERELIKERREAKKLAKEVDSKEPVAKESSNVEKQAEGPEM